MRFAHKPVTVTLVQFFRHFILLFVSLALVACGKPGDSVVSKLGVGNGNGSGYTGDRPGGERGTDVNAGSGQGGNNSGNTQSPPNNGSNPPPDETLPPPSGGGSGGGQCVINANTIEEGCVCLCGGTIWACRSGNSVSVGGACK